MMIHFKLLNKVKDRIHFLEAHTKMQYFGNNNLVDTLALYIELFNK